MSSSRSTIYKDSRAINSSGFVRPQKPEDIKYPKRRSRDPDYFERSPSSKDGSKYRDRYDDVVKKDSPEPKTFAYDTPKDPYAEEDHYNISNLYSDEPKYKQSENDFDHDYSRGNDRYDDRQEDQGDDMSREPSNVRDEHADRSRRPIVETDYVDLDLDESRTQSRDKPRDKNQEKKDREKRERAERDRKREEDRQREKERQKERDREREEREEQRKYDREQRDIERERQRERDKEKADEERQRRKTIKTTVERGEMTEFDDVERRPQKITDEIGVNTDKQEDVENERLESREKRRRDRERDKPFEPKFFEERGENTDVDPRDLEEAQIHQLQDEIGELEAIYEDEKEAHETERTDFDTRLNRLVKHNHKLHDTNRSLERENAELRLCLDDAAQQEEQEIERRNKENEALKRREEEDQEEEERKRQDSKPEYDPDLRERYNPDRQPTKGILKTRNNRLPAIEGRAVGELKTNHGEIRAGKARNLNDGRSRSLNRNRSASPRVDSRHEQSRQRGRSKERGKYDHDSRGPWKPVF